jgi:quercetin dioxygenase-like cupin family protein
MELAAVATELREIQRDDILDFEGHLSKHPGAVFGDNDQFPLKHSFAEGVYVREIFIPKGSILTGKIHRHSHPNFLMKGEVIVVTEHQGREHLKAPLSMISKPGTKRAILALEDTVWVTVHVTSETDLKKIEDYVIAPSYEALEASSKEALPGGAI